MESCRMLHVIDHCRGQDQSRVVTPSEMVTWLFRAFKMMNLYLTKLTLKTAGQEIYACLF